MSITLLTQQDVRRVRTLPFCYLCGQPLTRNPELEDDDHVPPSGLFLPEDRDFPLILPTHKACNNSRSQDDQVVADLIGLIHGQRPNPSHTQLRPHVWRDDQGQPLGAVSGLDLRGIIRRWVRGFHAALYAEFLPDDAASFLTQPPLPEAQPGAPRPLPDPVPDVVPELVREIKRNRLTGTLDRIECRNGKLRYECVWTQGDRGQWFCAYALDLYDWIDLGASPAAPPRGCVGAYRHPGGGTPRDATTATRLQFEIANRERFDPFGE